MVRLPDQYSRKTLRDLPIGESTWVTPWAMTATEEGCYLSLGQSLHSTPGGTVAMLVTHRADGWVVDITHCASFAWDRSPYDHADGARVVELIHAGGVER